MAYDLATRAQILTLKAYGLSTLGIEEYTGVCTRTIDRIFARAVARGFDPSAEPCRVLNMHVQSPCRRRSRFQANATRPPSAASVQSMHYAWRDIEGLNGERSVEDCDPPFNFHTSGTQQRSSVIQSSSEEELMAASPEAEQHESLTSSTTGSESSISSSAVLERASPTPVAPLRHHPSRYLQTQTAMSPLFESLVQSTAFPIVVWTGDGLVRDDAVRFLRDDLPSWGGIWHEIQTPRPTSEDSSLAQVAKMSQCVSLLENRSQTDFVRLRFHRLLQYQAFARCLAEAQAIQGTRWKAATTGTVDRIMQRVHARDWSTLTTIDKKRRREVFRAQRRAGRRLQIFCNHMGYGFLLLGSRAAVGKMYVVSTDFLTTLTPLGLESRFTDEMFHALVCYACNMFPGLQSLCEKLDITVRRLAGNVARRVSGSQLPVIASEMEAYMEARNRLDPPPNFISLELSDSLNPL